MNIRVGFIKMRYGETLIKIYFCILEAQNLSNKKYQTEFASGSTIASVRAVANETSATNINTVIAITKWPIV